MLIGYNNDVEYRDKEFHIQTEDHGKSTAKIESQIFHEGQILDTEIVDYDSVLEEHDEEEEAEEKVKSMMWQTHKGLYERLVSGDYDERVGLEPLENDDVDAPDPDEFEPGQDRVPTAAKEIEEKGEEAVQEFHESQAQRHTNLDNLKDHLEEVDSDAAAEPDEGAGESDDKPEPAELDDALADVGEELGGEDPNESSVVVKEDDSGAVVESHPDPPSDAKEKEPQKLDSDAIEPADNPNRSGSSVPAPSETGQSPVAPNTDDRGAAGRSGAVSELPKTGQRAWRGCEDPDGMLSIVPLVEAYLGD